jgi:two-component system, NtrC family, response regulator AtoC
MNSIKTSTVEDLPPEEIIFGRTPRMQAVRANLKKVAAANVPVLIRGESGTGKETIARIIHLWSVRRKEPFVKVPCPAIPEALLESELFGYEKGAFTGAHNLKRGLVERADGGTLLLDEVAELSIPMQAKLLELLQNGRFSRLGGGDSTVIDARIQCTTSHRLEQEIAAGTFRNDLFYRINVFVIDLPPMRERRDDIETMAEYFRQRFNREFERDTPALSPRTVHLLEEYRWPGNIREFENLMKRYVILDSEDELARELLGTAFIQNIAGDLNSLDDSVSLKSLTRDAVRDLERKIILQVLHANNWNRKEAARILKVSYRGLFYKIKNAGVPHKKARNLSSAADVSEVI